MGAERWDCPQEPAQPLREPDPCWRPSGRAAGRPAPSAPGSPGPARPLTPGPAGAGRLLLEPLGVGLLPRRCPHRGEDRAPRRAHLPLGPLCLHPDPAALCWGVGPSPGRQADRGLLWACGVDLTPALVAPFLAGWTGSHGHRWLTSCPPPACVGCEVPSTHREQPEPA